MSDSIGTFDSVAPLPQADGDAAAGGISDAGPQTGGREDHRYVVVARRYRPRGFDELVGQDHVARALKNAIETRRIGHAYLFTGARGVGKTSTARIFAKALNDPAGPSATPDNTCDVAEAIDAGEDVDVIEIDGASNRGIDEIRSLRANVGVRPSRSRYKIYIIDEVHMLTAPAFNALLKTLEEPPDHVKFIFCTTDPEKIPITVLSRCQRYDFAPVEIAEIVGRLQSIVEAESATADVDALELIARRAAGSMRDSQSLLEQVLSFSEGHLTADHVHGMLGTADDQRLHSIARALADRDAAESIRLLDAAIEAGVDAGRLAEQLLGYFRDLMAVTVGCEASLMRYASISLHDELAELGRDWGLQTVLAVVGMIDQTLVRIRHSVHGRVLLESTLMQVCTLPDLQAVADLAAAAGDRGVATRGNDEKKKPPAAVAAPAGDRRDPSGPTLAPSEPTAAPSEPTLAPSEPTAAPSEPTAAPSEPTAAPSEPTVAPCEPTAPPSGPAVAANQAVATNGAMAAVPQPHFDTSGSASGRDARAVSNPHAAAKPARSPDVVGVATASESAAAADASGRVWTASGGGLSPSNVAAVWSQALDEMDPMTATLARGAQRVEPVSASVLRLVFPGESHLASGRCQRAEHQKEITATLARIVGCPVGLEVTAEMIRDPPKPSAAKPSGRSRMQRMREVESNDMVRSCLELFEAEIVRVDLPRE